MSSTSASQNSPTPPHRQQSSRPSPPGLSSQQQPQRSREDLESAAVLKLLNSNPQDASSNTATRSASESYSANMSSGSEVPIRVASTSTDAPAAPFIAQFQPTNSPN